MEHRNRNISLGIGDQPVPSLYALMRFGFTDEAADYFRQMRAKTPPPPVVEQQPPGGTTPAEAPVTSRILRKPVGEDDAVDQEESWARKAAGSCR